MVAVSFRAQVVRQQTETGWWELATRPPVASIRPYVREYTGYVESSPGLVQRREFPAPAIVLIFDLGPLLRLIDPRDQTRFRCHGGGFVAGMDDTYTITEHDGISHGVQVNLTPISARRLLGIPMALTTQPIAMDDLFTGVDRDVLRRLQDARTWDARFDLLDGLFARRMASAPPAARAPAWAFEQIEASGGLIDIAGLARELGCSPKHLIAQFREHIGLPPKLVARLVRFDRVVRHLRTGADADWSQLAAELGYYDQSHLIRDFRQFTGATPTEARRMILAGPVITT